MKPIMNLTKTKETSHFGTAPELNMQAMCVENLSVYNWIFLRLFRHAQWM